MDMDNAGLYLWLWIIIANAGAFAMMSNMGGSTRDHTRYDNDRRPL